MDLDAVERLYNVELRYFRSQGAHFALSTGAMDFPWDEVLELKPVLNLGTWNPKGFNAKDDPHSAQHKRLQQCLAQFYGNSPLTTLLIFDVSLPLRADHGLRLVDSVRLPGALAVGGRVADVLPPLMFMLTCCPVLRTLDLRFLHHVLFDVLHNFEYFQWRLIWRVC